MICSTSSFNKLLLALTAALLLAGCLRPEARPSAAAGERLLAVLPLENLSASSAPLPQLQAALAEQLRRQGLAVLPDAELTAFMARHRLRHTGSLDAETVRAFRDELGVTGILLTSLELYQAGETPKIALHSRLVQSGSAPVIIWTDSIGLSGDAAPGLLELGLIDDIDKLAARAFGSLGQSLAVRLTGRSGMEKAPTGLAPAVWFRSPALDDHPPHRIAVLPFVNQSERRHAGELLHLHCIRQLVETGKFQVIEPGVVRSTLMQYRVIIPEGASQDIAALLFDKLDVDLLLSGKVMTYEDYQGGEGAPAVFFTTQGVARRQGEVVWAAQSHRRDDQGSFFFGLGKMRTAHELAARMTGELARLLAGKTKAPPPPFDGRGQGGG